MFIKRGDNVTVLAGKEKGKSGKVIQVMKTAGSLVVEGLNMKKRHVRPKRQGEKGQIMSMPAPINASNVMLVCAKCGKATRASKKILADGGYARACKKCKEVLE